MFQCMECGRKFRTTKAAERASSEGCPGCGGVDIDLADDEHVVDSEGIDGGRRGECVPETPVSKQEWAARLVAACCQAKDCHGDHDPRHGTLIADIVAFADRQALGPTGEFLRAEEVIKAVTAGWDRIHDYSRIPENLHDGLNAYVLTGRPTGQFLQAVISNDLKEACARGDLECLEALPTLVSWFYNVAPGSCWGSPEAYESWREKGGLAGTHGEERAMAIWAPDAL